VTRLRKLMLDELQRAHIRWHRGFREVLPPFARSARPRTYFASTRVTYFATASSRRRPSKGVTHPSVFSSSRHSDGRIFPIISLPKHRRRVPTVLSREETARLIPSGQNLMHPPCR
jgi:integrase